MAADEPIDRASSRPSTPSRPASGQAGTVSEGTDEDEAWFWAGVLLGAMGDVVDAWWGDGDDKR